MRWRLSRMGRAAAMRPRLWITLALGLAVGALLPVGWLPQALMRWLLAWNVGTALYAALAALMMLRSTQRHMHQRARLHDDGQRVILLLVALAALASLVAIAGELSLAGRPSRLHGGAQGHGDQ